MERNEIALRMQKVSKRFPGMLAVDEIDLEINAGEVHAIVGENGAGKSTLTKIIAGAFADYTGKVFISGRETDLRSPSKSKRSGIQMIQQELSLALPLSIAENLLVGRLPKKGRFGVDYSAMISESTKLLERVGLDLDPMTPVEEISQHEAQGVEIAKALGNDPKILVMDEPTSSLGREEIERLFEIIRQLRGQGLAIIYISHHLSEIFEVSDKVTVMRDGRKVATENISDVTPAKLVEMMVGRPVSDFYACRISDKGAEKLRVEKLSRYGFFHNISFSIAKGEILGICGLSGSGRSELGRSICGIDPVDSGSMIINGNKTKYKDYKAAINAGLAYLTEDRKLQGLALRLDVSDNALAAVIPRNCQGPFYSSGKGLGALRDLISSLQVNPSDPGAIVGNLSGGNQQKVLLAKWMITNPEILILDEPTRGVDIGAKAVIHQAIAKLADEGTSVLLISSDLPELIALSDRVAIMQKGHLTGEIAKTDCSEHTLLLAANGQVAGATI
jgi:ribose transport system ATP-binding protein